jgi:hypothetical protein
MYEKFEYSLKYLEVIKWKKYNIFEIFVSPENCLLLS